MLNEEQFSSLLERSEDETLDFKATGYDLTNEDNRFSLVKDIICMANTPRDSTSFIVLGIKKYPDGTSVLRGIETHPDDADLQSQFTERIYPVPDFSYYPVNYDDKEYGLIAIPPTKRGPCVPLRDYGRALRQWQIYFRRGSMNDVALPEDIANILTWFGPHVPPSVAYENDDPSWEILLRECQNFDPSRYYILIVSPCSESHITDLNALGLIPWVGVLDFDPDSESEGIFAALKNKLETRRSVHLVTPHDRPSLNLHTGTYWFFPRGLAGREGTVERGLWKAWQKALGANLSDSFRRLAGACSPHPVTCLVLWYDATLTRHLQSSLEAVLGSFGETANIVIVTDNPGDLQIIAAEVDATLLEFPLHQFCSGLLSLFGSGPEITEDGIILPSSSGAPLPLSEKDKHWLEEELDIIHLGVGVTPPPNRHISREFLRGAEISWYDLGLHCDIERDISARLQRRLNTELGRRRTSRVNLYHAPGAGGTTLARRMLWNLHRNFPCAVLRKTNPPETVDRLYRLASLSGLPVLLLVDGAEISDRKVDELYDHLRSRHIPAVLLQVLRRFTAQEEGPRLFYLQAELSSVEAERFAHVYAREEPKRRNDIMALLNSPDPRFRSAFYFGLHTFQKDFLGLEPFISSRLESLTLPQEKVVGFLAIAHHYAQKPIHAQAFAELLGLPRARPVDLASALPTNTLELFVQLERGAWRTTHQLIATEILQQLLWPTDTDRRLWKQNLSGWAMEFAEMCRGSAPVPGEELLDVVRRTFIYRDNAELLGTERAGTKLFSQLMQDIPSPEGALQVLRKLTELYPDEAHFHAHLGRFLSVEREEYPEALECIDHAIALNDYDSVLHHMRGMVLRKQVYQIIEDGGALSDVVKYAKQSSDSFIRTRDLNPDDEHGYISEVQMLVRVLDYAGRQHARGVLGYLASPTANPFLMDCFERAEDLLERVRRNREGQGASPYEENCRANLDALYGRYDLALQTWGNLLSRSDVYKPPVRRQVIWTYLARRKRSWDEMSQREIDRAVSLLEENLREEPNIDSNLRLWVQAVRRSTSPPSVEAVIERVAYWHSNTGSLEASFYLYVFYALQAIEGSFLARDSANRFLDECRTKARFRRNRTKSFEWFGEGTGIGRLVHHSQLGEWQTEVEFWENIAPLARLNGRIVKIGAPQAGEIEAEGSLSAFFVPARGGYVRGRSENQLVTFFLGFSYDGLRAWEVKDA